MENLYVTSEITLNKTADKRISPIPTNTEFFTYDRRVAKKYINFQFEGDPLNLTDANVILGFHFVAAGQSVIFESVDGSIKIEDPEAGKVNVILPNDIYAYSGSVIIYVYVEFPNGQSLDYPAFTTDFQESWIDQDLDEMAEFYVKRFEDLRNEVLASVERVETLLEESLHLADKKLSELEERILKAQKVIDAIDPEELANELAAEIKLALEEHLRLLELRLDELQEGIENAGFVKPEEMDERIDEELWELMSGGSRTKRHVLTFHPVPGSPHMVRRRYGAKVDTIPTLTAGNALTDDERVIISRRDNETIELTNTSTIADTRFQLVAHFNMVEAFKRDHPAIVQRYAPQTIWEEIDMVERFTANICLITESLARANSAEASQVSVPETYLTYWHSENGGWVESQAHFENEVSTLKISPQLIRHETGSSNNLNGYIIGLLYGGAVPGLQSRRMDAEIRYVALDYDLVMNLENYEYLINRRMDTLEKRVDEDVSNFLLGGVRNESFESTSEGKIRASLVENPHFFGRRLTTGLPSLSNPATGTEITQSQYDNLWKDNGAETQFNDTTANGMMQVVFRWDLLETFKRRYPDLIRFFDPQTKEEEFVLYRRMVEKVMFYGDGYINQTTNHLFTAARLNPEGNGREDMFSHDKTYPVRFSYEIIPFSEGAQIGRAFAFFYGPDRQSTGQNTVRVVYVKIEFELSYSIADLFEPKGLGMVSLAQFNQLAQRVNDLEKKG